MIAENINNDTQEDSKISLRSSIVNELVGVVLVVEKLVVVGLGLTPTSVQFQKKPSA